MKHTPGPWLINYTKFYGAIVRYHIAGHKDDSVYPICEHVIEQKPDAHEQFANANLIAAAPELLEALQSFAEHFGPLEDNHMLNDEVRHCFSLARAAIAKATGE